MIKASDSINKKISKLFYILMISIFVWFVIMQLFGTNEHKMDRSDHSVIYSGTFVWEKGDGSRQTISVPGQYDVPAKQTMVLSTTLPKDYDKTSFAIRSSLQTVRFYIDGKLRKEYDTSNVRKFGKNSASRYVFCKTSEKDAGKELRLELTTNTSNYSGIVNTVYCGDPIQIWEYLFSHYASETIIGSFLFFTSIVTILFSVALGIVYKTKFDMEYFGWCMLMGSSWMLGESKFRQLFMPNTTAFSTLCFLMIILCPIPIVLYVNSLQHGRYRKIFRWIGIVAFFNFILSTILHLTGIADYIETLPIAHMILTITFITVFCTFVIGYRNHKNKQDRLLFVGLLIAMLSVVFESISVYFVVSISGIFIGIGISLLLLSISYERFISFVILSSISIIKNSVRRRNTWRKCLFSSCRHYLLRSRQKMNIPEDTLIALHNILL